MQSDNPRNADEIDFGQLFQIIGNGFKELFKRFLMSFSYLKNNMIVLGGLLVVGALIGFGLNYTMEKKLMTQVIVKPNFESKDYLYDVVEELQSTIRSKDTSFFDKIGISIADLKGFDVAIEPIQEEEDEKALDNDLKYLELLQNFKDKNFADDFIMTELLKKSVTNHRLIFTYKKASSGKANMIKILKYLNSNVYFDEIGKIFRENIQSRITKNKELVGQIDALVSDYSKSLSKQDGKLGEAKVYLESENGLNIPSLLSLKNRLLKEIEEKKVESVTAKQVIGIINIGNTQEVKKTLFNRFIISIPLVLISLFFIVSLLRYLNRKAIALNIS